MVGKKKWTKKCLHFDVESTDVAVFIIILMNNEQNMHQKPILA